MNREPFFRRPTILSQPNIPKPLHGMTPARLMGKMWWDARHSEAYGANNFCCWACGIDKDQARYHQWLEGHAQFTYDYLQGTLEFSEVAALCHSCHGFIHSGLTYMKLQAGKIDQDRANYIMKRGDEILGDVGQNPWTGTRRVVYAVLGGRSELLDTSDYDGSTDYRGEDIPWENWRMVIEGRVFLPRFKSMAEWQKHYGSGFKDE